MTGSPCCGPARLFRLTRSVFGMDPRMRILPLPAKRLNRQQAPFFLVGLSFVSGDAPVLLEPCLQSGGKAGCRSTNWCDY